MALTLQVLFATLWLINWTKGQVTGQVSGGFSSGPMVGKKFEINLDKLETKESATVSLEKLVKELNETVYNLTTRVEKAENNTELKKQMDQFVKEFKEQLTSLRSSVETVKQQASTQSQSSTDYSGDISAVNSRITSIGQRIDDLEKSSSSSSGATSSDIQSINTQLDNLKAQLSKLDKKPTCPSYFKYIKDPEVCFLVSFSYDNWINSQTDCQKYGGRLIVFDNSRKQDAIANYMGVYYPSYEFFVGAFSAKGTWVWVNGMLDSDVKAEWNPGEPNWSGYGCGNYWNNRDTTQGHLLDDIPCYDKRYKICEIPMY